MTAGRSSSDSETGDETQVLEQTRPTFGGSVPTRLPSKREASRSMSGPSFRALDLPAPETVLRDSELDQTRKTAIAGVLFNLLGIPAVTQLTGDPLAKQFFLVGLLVGLLNNLWLLYAVRSPSNYRDRNVIIYFAVAPVHNAFILLYLGVFGPVYAMFVFNVFTSCLAYRTRVAQVALVASLLPPVVLGTVITLGWLEDPAVISLGPYIGVFGKAVAVFAMGAFLLLTYQQGNRSRELLVASLGERDGAVRFASHREALLVEARRELEEALQAGGFGRFSEQTLGSFRLGAVVGRGGMGEVYEAVHVDTGEPAAVKLLLPSVLGQPEYVRRFLREVRIAASLDSPHVVRVLEVGDENAPMPYLAMERLVGETLSDRLRQGALDLEAVGELLRQVGEGVAAANAAGVVHRDLKPQNLFVTSEDPPVWKILDFGVSKLSDGTDTLTHGAAIGTPRYMAPEQAKGGDVDLRTDLYAVGAITYRALTGQAPFAGEESAAVLVRVLESMPRRPTSLAELPYDVDAFMAIALAKDPEERFQSAHALVEAFERAATGKLTPEESARADRLLDARPWAEE